jgi:hypothetical protein
MIFKTHFDSRVVRASYKALLAISRGWAQNPK